MLRRDRGGEGSREDSRLGEAHARDADIVVEAAACFRGGADAIVSSNTFPSLPLIDPETLEFEINVDGLVSSGGLGGPAILPLALAKMAQLTQGFPDQELFRHRWHLGFHPGAVVLPARLRNRSGLHGGDARSGRRAECHQAPAHGLDKFIEEHAKDGWKSVEDFRGSAATESCCSRRFVDPSLRNSIRATTAGGRLRTRPAA